MSIEEIDRDFAMLAELCSASELTDEQKMSRSIEESRRLAKEQVRRHLGID